MNDERNNITTLVPTKSDQELANEFKSRIAEAHEPLLKLLDEIDKAGFYASVGVGKNAFGKYQIMQLQLVKNF